LAKFTAVIDFGSNSVRLVIFEKTSRFGFKVIHESKSRVRVGEGAYQKGGILQQEPMDRALTALTGFNSIIRSFKVRKILAIATSALRDAPNKNLFINKVKRDLGVNIKVIDGEAEALLGGIACANLLKLDKKAVTIDIGGGSTEFALIENREVLSTYSLNLGTVRLKELFENDSNLDNAKSYINNELLKLPLELQKNILVGIGGTIRALSKIIQKRYEYPLKRVHGYQYSFYQNRDFIDEVINTSKEELLKIGFKSERVDVIRWGVLIFREAIQLFNTDTIITSGVGIREGIFLKDSLRNMHSKYPNNFNPSIRNILDEFQAPNEKAFKNLFKISLELFELLKDSFDITEYRKTVENISKLIEIGIKIDFYGNTKNGFQMILNRFIYDVSHKESVLVATIIRFSHKVEISEKVFNQFQALLPALNIMKNIHSIIYLSKILTLDYADSKQFNLEFIENSLKIKIFDKALYYMINEKMGLLENLDVKLEYIDK